MLRPIRIVLGAMGVGVFMGVPIGAAALVALVFGGVVPPIMLLGAAFALVHIVFFGIGAGAAGGLLIVLLGTTVLRERGFPAWRKTGACLGTVLGACVPVVGPLAGFGMDLAGGIPLAICGAPAGWLCGRFLGRVGWEDYGSRRGLAPTA